MKKRKFPLLLKLALAAPLLLLALYAALCLAYPLCVFNLNHRHVPPELKEPPREIARMAETFRASRSAPRSPSLKSRIDAATSASLAKCLEKGDYLAYRLTLDSGNPGSALLLRIKQQMEPLRDEIYTRIFPEDSYINQDCELVRPDIPWDPTKSDVSAEQARWLESHRDLLDLITRYCQTDGPTPLTAEECLQLEQKRVINWADLYWKCVLMAKTNVTRECARLVSAAGKWALQRGDAERAQRRCQELLTLNLETGLARLEQWIESAVMPLPDAQGLLARLDQVKREQMTRAVYTSHLIDHYLVDRSDALGLLNRPFKPEEWGHSPDDLYLCRFGPVKIPKPLFFFIMYEELRAPSRIQALDGEWQEGLDMMQLPWPQVPAQTPCVHYSAYDDPCGPENGDTFRSRMESALRLETRLNLVRAALCLLQDPRAAANAQNLNFKDDPHHPWRDPFTERPFRVIESTTQTLIYSLGPDLADQHGKPFDEALTERTHYDIGIRIPKPLQK